MAEQRVNNKLYEEDSIPSLPRVNNKTKTHQAMSQHGIRTIGDLKTLPSDQLPSIRRIEGMHRNTTNRFLPGHSPNRVIDRHQADNPYQSKYGEKWQEQLKSCPAFSPLRPISKLANFIAEESHRLMEESVHQEDCFFITIRYRY